MEIPFFRNSKRLLINLIGGNSIFYRHVKTRISVVSFGNSMCFGILYVRLGVEFLCR